MVENEDGEVGAMMDGSVIKKMKRAIRKLPRETEKRKFSRTVTVTYHDTLAPVYNEKQV